MARHSAKILLFLLLIPAALCLPAGCSDKSSDSDPKVEKLAKELGSQLDSLSKLLVEPLSKNDPAGAEKVLAGFYRQCSQTGKPIENGALVLNAKGVTFAQRDPAPGHPSGVPVRLSARDYSSYQIVQKTMKSSRTEVGVVYLAQDKLYVVCHPVGEGKPVGILVLGILGSYLEARLGISGEEFLNMDIKS